MVKSNDGSRSQVFTKKANTVTTQNAKIASQKNSDIPSRISLNKDKSTSQNVSPTIGGSPQFR
jgi:hypothetical protein